MITKEWKKVMKQKIIFKSDILLKKYNVIWAGSRNELFYTKQIIW